ncbi:LIM/homeobox protein Lhx9-like, partial [Aphis craccivora]
TESLQCRGCSDPITDRFLLKVSDKIWHVSCLRCCVCNLVLEDEPSCFIKDDSIYCRQDYARGPREKTEAAGRINHKIRRVSKIPVEDTVAQCLAPVNVTL